MIRFPERSKAQIHETLSLTITTFLEPLFYSAGSAFFSAVLTVLTCLTGRAIVSAGTFAGKGIRRQSSEKHKNDDGAFHSDLIDIQITFPEPRTFPELRTLYSMKPLAPSMTMHVDVPTKRRSKLHARPDATVPLGKVLFLVGCCLKSSAKVFHKKAVQALVHPPQVYE